MINGIVSNSTPLSVTQFKTLVNISELLSLLCVVKLYYSINAKITVTGVFDPTGLDYTFKVLFTAKCFNIYWPIQSLRLPSLVYNM